MITGSDRPPALDDLTDSQLRQIDQICDGFEAAWKSERRPRLETFLDPDAGLPRRPLLHELVLLDVEYRKRLGEAPRIAEYQERFS